MITSIIIRHYAKESVNMRGDMPDILRVVGLQIERKELNEILHSK